MTGDLRMQRVEQTDNCARGQRLPRPNSPTIATRPPASTEKLSIFQDPRYSFEQMEGDAQIDDLKQRRGHDYPVLQRVAKSIAKQAEAENCDHHEQTGEQRDPPAERKEANAISDHSSKIRGRRLDAQSDETKRGDE